MKRIILLGLPKCGTMSFTESLASIGYNVGHWTNDKGEYIGKLIGRAYLENKHLLEYVPELNAITQMDYISFDQFILPQVFLYKVLLKQNPDALFILNYRNVENHVKSICAWGDLLERLELFGITNLEQFISDHNSHIRKHYSGRKNFLEVDIENSNNETISDFIGLNFKMSHTNKTII